MIRLDGIIFNCIQNWTMTCEARMGEAVKNVPFLSQKIFSCAGDRMAQKLSLYVELQDYVEAYNFVMIMWAFSGIFLDGLVCMVFYVLCYRLTLIGYPDRQAGAKMSLYVELYESVKVHDENT